MKHIIAFLFVLVVCLSCVGCMLTPTEADVYYDVTYVVGENRYTVKIQEGQTPHFYGTTERADDEQFNYSFDGWDKEFAPVSSNVTYTAQYKAVQKDAPTVTVNFVVGTEIYAVKTVVGELPVFTGLTEKESEGGISYVFAGWDKEIAPAYTNDTYIAQFVEGTASYEVSFVLEGTTIAVLTLKGGEYAELPSDVVLPGADRYDGILWIGIDRPIKGTTRIEGVYYNGDAALAQWAYTTPLTAAGDDLAQSIGAVLYLAKQNSTAMQWRMLERLRAIGALEAEQLGDYERALLLSVLATLPEKTLGGVKAELLPLLSDIVAEVRGMENPMYQLSCAVFAAELLGKDTVENLLSDETTGYSYNGFTLQNPEALLEQAFLFAYSEQVTDEYRDTGVSYAYIADRRRNSRPH